MPVGRIAGQSARRGKLCSHKDALSKRGKEECAADMVLRRSFVAMRMRQYYSERRSMLHAWSKVEVVNTAVMV